MHFQPQIGKPGYPRLKAKKPNPLKWEKPGFSTRVGYPGPITTLKPPNRNLKYILTYNLFLHSFSCSKSRRSCPTSCVRDNVWIFSFHHYYIQFLSFEKKSSGISVLDRFQNSCSKYAKNQGFWRAELRFDCIVYQNTFQPIR